MVPRPRRYHLGSMDGDHHDGENALARIVREAMEEAATRGLCREGEVEFACGRLQDARPGWPAPKRLAFVLRTRAASP